MKKITLLILAVFTVGIINAQRTVETETTVLPLGITNFDQSKANDTIFPPSFLLPCSDTLTFYGGAFGYVTGNNEFGDAEKAQKFLNIPTNTTVISALVYAIAKSTTGSSTLKIYSVNPTTKGPQTQLGESVSIANSAIAAGLTAYNFTTPVDVADQFFVSVVLPTGATDTLIVVSTKDDCYSNDSLAWERWDNGSWWSIESQWGMDATNPLNIDLVIFPIINTTVGMTEITQDNLISIFPNPANDIINIAAMNTIEDINIYNSLGQIVRSYNVQDNIYVLNVSDLQKGFYFLQIQTVQGVVSKTVIVN